MHTDPYPGEVWFAELGMVEKSRPVLVLAYPGEPDARALTVVAPLTSQVRGGLSSKKEYNHEREGEEQSGGGLAY